MTQDYAPDLGGMARRHVELCRRFGDAENTMSVSTVGSEYAAAFDTLENYTIARQPFSFSEANRFTNQLRWAQSLATSWKGAVDVLHCGNIRPTGYAVLRAHRVLRIPYMLYVNGGDLLRERQKSSRFLKREMARRIFSNAAGIVATSQWVAELSVNVMRAVGVRQLPPVAAIGLGTDPAQFSPDADLGSLRQLWGIDAAPVMLTVARLVPHKGQDTGLRVLAALRDRFPDLRYVMVGEGNYEGELRRLAAELGVEDGIVFAGALRDNQLPEAYATSTLYLGLSRVDNEINVEGFGIAFLEAAASGLPSVAGDSGGVRSAVRENETAFLVPPSDVVLAAEKVAVLLADPDLRRRMGDAARKSVEEHYNWDRMARETREFTLLSVAKKGRSA